MEGFAGEIWDLAIRGRVANGEEDEGLLVWRSATDLSEEGHRGWCMCEGREPSAVEGLNEESDSDSNAFGHVVVFETRSIWQEVVVSPEDDDEPRCIGNVGFYKVGSQGRESLEPFRRCLRFVECSFFLFSGFADLSFEFGV